MQGIIVVSASVLPTVTAHYTRPSVLHEYGRPPFVPCKLVQTLCREGTDGYPNKTDRILFHASSCRLHAGKLRMTKETHATIDRAGKRPTEESTFSWQYLGHVGDRCESRRGTCLRWATTASPCLHEHRLSSARRIVPPTRRKRARTRASSNRRGQQYYLKCFRPDR